MKVLKKILKNIEGIGALDDPLRALGATQSTMLCLDNDPQAFLGAISNANCWQER